jgi:hypothetical protein
MMLTGKTQAIVDAELAEVKAEAERISILVRLDEIDRKSIRALRAGEADRLAAFEAEAAMLREGLV